MGIHLIKGLNPLLQYVADLMSVFQIKPIAEPQKYRDKVLAAKDVLKHDISGLVNTTLDYAITMASSVTYSADTEDDTLTEYLNTWLEGINTELRGRVPTGVAALSKEYFRERWKGSSHLLMRTAWEKQDGLYLPSTMFFIDGEDIIVKNADDETIRLGDEQYSLRLSEKDDMKLPHGKDEMIYVQTPYDAWGTREPRPFIIRRGLWHNLVFMRMLSEKGEFVVARALEYLFLIKKGTEKMFLDGNISYSRDDLEKISKDFQELLAKKKYEIPVINGLPTGAPTYATQFDTTMEHLIPDYSKALSQELFIQSERRLLAGLGFIDMKEGVIQSKRLETQVNPKPFVAEVRQGVSDFKDMIQDIARDIVVKNSSKNKKWKNLKINIHNSPITEFLTDDAKTMLRSLYDRGLLSKQTTVELLGEVPYDIEVIRRDDEDKKGDDETMFPPVIQNQGNLPGETPFTINAPANKDNKNPDKIPADKKGPEKRNYKKASLDVRTTKNYIRMRQEDPSDFEQNSFRIISLSEVKGIKAVIGRKKGVSTTTIQSYLFMKSKWDEKEAEDWVKQHKGELEEAMEDVLAFDAGEVFALPDVNKPYDKPTMTKQPVSSPTLNIKMPPIWGDEGGVILVRHGKTSMNNPNEKVDKIRGWRDIPLDIEGIQQAHDLADKFKDADIDEIHSSDLKRAYDTAKAIATHVGHTLPIIRTKDLRPWHLGDFEGQSSSDAAPAIAEYVDKPDQNVPNGESFHSFSHRFLGCLQAKLEEAKKDGKHIMLVTHYRGLKLAKSWVKAGAKDFKIDKPQFVNYDSHAITASAYKIVTSKDGIKMNEIFEPANDKEAPLPGPNFTRDETNVVNSPYPPESMASYEDAPYHTNKDLPPAVKKYPSGAQTAFRKSWMNAWKTYHDEKTAFRVAYSVLKKWMKSGGLE